MKKKNQIGKLNLSKNTIGNLSILRGGALPQSGYCQVTLPEPLSIEVICWTEPGSDASYTCL